VEAIDFYLIVGQNPSIASNVDERESNRRIRNAFYGQSSFDYKDLLNLNLGLLMKMHLQA
jgi:hypothetical protein